MFLVGIFLFFEQGRPSLNFFNSIFLTCGRAVLTSVVKRERPLFSSSFSGGRSVNRQSLSSVDAQASFSQWLGTQPTSAQSWIKALGQDSYKAGRLVMVPSAGAGAGAEGGGAEGGGVSLSEVAFCLGEGDDSASSPFSLCSLREKVWRAMDVYVIILAI